MEGSKSPKKLSQITKKSPPEAFLRLLGVQELVLLGCIWFLTVFVTRKWAKSDPKYSRNSPGRPTRAAKLHKTSPSGAHGKKNCFLKWFCPHFSMLLMPSWLMFFNMFCPSYANVDVVRISVSPRREHDFQGFEDLRITKQSSKFYAK